MSLYRDDNNAPVFNGVAGIYTTNGIKVDTTGAATTEVSISALHTAAANAHSEILVSVICIGTNPALYAFGAAGAAASYTGNTNMHLIAANSEQIRRVPSSAVSFYHLQVTGASTIQVRALT